MKLRYSLPEKFCVVLFSAAIFLIPFVVRAAPGDVDLSFNAGTFLNTQGSGMQVRTIKIQPDGKVIIGGVFEKINGTTRWSIARLNQDGSLDASFTSPFIYTTTQPQVADVEILSNGQILVGGYLITANGIKRLMRLNSDGTVDPTFSADPNSGGLDVAVQSDGKLVVIGAPSGVRRLNPDGSPDADFGHFLTDLRALALQPDGKTVVAGINGNFFEIARFLPNGQLDGTFGFNGRVNVNNYVFDLALQTNGQIVVSGQFTGIAGAPRNKLARINTDGSLDAGFNTPISLGEVYASEVQPDGKIFAVGRFFLPGDPTPYQTTRFNPDGSIDMSFTRLTEQNSANVIHNAALQSDGRIYIGGSFSEIGGVSRQLVARLLGGGQQPVQPTKMKIADGNILIGSPGQGFVLKSPTGAACKLLSINNAGEMVLTTTACP